jgi:hypothetical protein
MVGKMEGGSRLGKERTRDMRIAVTIIAGVLSLVIALQSSSAQIGGWLSTNERRHAGDGDWFVVSLYLLGAGFAYRVPALAVVMFGLAGVISVGLAANGDGNVFGLWGLVALVLAAMSAFAWREKRRILRRQILHSLIDRELVPMEPGHPTRGADPTR